MEPIFDRDGECVGWLDGDRVVDRGSRRVAWVDDDAVFDASGRQLGWLDEGFFRDRRGHAVAFVRGATGGPITPITGFAPSPPMGLSVGKPLAVRIAAMKPIGSLSWGRSWEEFWSM